MDREIGTRIHWVLMYHETSHAPHPDGKVERSQLTDLNEFWFHHAPTEDEIDQRIEEWQFDYNGRRPHG